MNRGQIGEFHADPERGREIATVIGVEAFGNAAHRPGRIGLAPDRIAQHQGRLKLGRLSQGQWRRAPEPPGDD